ncbi:hypothetical protein L211DRAFT_859181 [Terfezia boudieri ATCC MYA-4762]|uniref:Uncharacterized protein n=1 Tax=Terfezia boudieri ATCC MYA-4762 TaxID=1051890 RepID=A0A3N4LCD9_9PEZI|nr:hypothetical protein L211DRAFT_859181 [Terfezia boudieri ATCC MYA-4762]
MIGLQAVKDSLNSMVELIETNYWRELHGKGHGTPIDIYKVAIIDTIVTEVQSTPGEDRCVLLLGYEEEMKRLFQEANPGLQATDEVKHVAGEVLGRARIRPNFGNGSEVDKYQSRISKLPPQQRTDEVLFMPDDFDPEFARGASAAANCQKLFEDMIGCERIVQKLEGTGKTVVVRKMGKVYYDMGFLTTDKVIECSSSDLISVNEIVDILTKKRYIGKMVVILAGYDQDMPRLLRVNFGLSSSLFPEEIMFKCMSPTHRISTNILQDTGSKVNYQLCDMIAKLSALPLWGNARDIIALAKSIVGVCTVFMTVIGIEIVFSAIREVLQLAR